MEEKLELIDGFFNKGWCCDLDEVYNAVMEIVERNKDLQEIEQYHKAENGKLKESLDEHMKLNAELIKVKANDIGEHINNEYIHISKIKEMLEEVNIDRNAIKKEIEEAIKEKNKEYHADLLGHLRVNYGMKRVLQELLKEGE